jgi:hypothetical protein
MLWKNRETRQPTPMTSLEGDELRIREELLDERDVARVDVLALAPCSSDKIRQWTSRGRTARSERTAPFKKSVGFSYIFSPAA